MSTDAPPEIRGPGFSLENWLPGSQFSTRNLGYASADGERQPTKGWLP